MTVNKAVEFFKHIPKIERKLKTNHQDVGLGYVTLGQPATTPFRWGSAANEVGF